MMILINLIREVPNKKISWPVSCYYEDSAIKLFRIDQLENKLKEVAIDKSW